MKIMYFAWMREHIGAPSEEITLPDHISTVRALADHLKSQSGGHAKALSNLDVVRVAVNHVYADLDTHIRHDDEVAFFPPVTGG